jgi:hypothetical protein
MRAETAARVPLELAIARQSGRHIEDNIAALALSNARRGNEGAAIKLQNEASAPTAAPDLISAAVSLPAALLTMIDE